MSKLKPTYLILFFLVLPTPQSLGALLTLSVTGQFSNSVSATATAAPNGIWSLDFGMDSSPSVFNISGDDFDVAFSDLHYALNGMMISENAEHIRFYSANNGGLFSIFFGPELGFVGEIPIPIFEFDGLQLYMGSPLRPEISEGEYAISEWLYSDAMNFDDHFPALNHVTVTATPVATISEPATRFFPLFLIGAIFGKRMLQLKKPKFEERM
jgi:hypothetical protein